MAEIFGKSTAGLKIAELIMKNQSQGGNEQMETKSRYAVIAELEEKKRDYILQRDSLLKTLKAKQRNLKEMGRELEDKQEETQEFEESMAQQETTLKELINGIDESLKRFSDAGTKKK